MVSFYLTASSAVNLAPRVDVFINSQLMRGVQVNQLTESSGIEPTSAKLLFPTRNKGAYPARNNDQVAIYINRANHPDPFFRGFVTGFGDYVTTEAGEYVEVFCLDEMVMLQNATVTRNYNLRDNRDNYSESLTIREIANDLNNILNTTVGADAPQIMTQSFPNDFPGEVKLLSQPFNTALTTLLDLAGEYKWNIRRSYTPTQTLIYAYKTGTGETADLILATDQTSGPRDQPHGVANVNVLRKETNYVDIVNKAVVVGDRKVIETSLALSKAWPTSKEALLSDLDAYTDKGTEDDPNPLYDPEAERLARAYRFGKVNTGAFLEYPDLEPRLLQQPPYSYTEATADYAKPFVVYQFAGEATWNVTFNFQMKDNEVITEKPLIRANATSGPTVDPEIPSSIYLECAYRLRSPLVVETSKYGPANRTISRDFAKEEFKYKYQTAWFSIDLATGPLSAEFETNEVYSATYNASTTVVRNDTTAAETWGVQRIKAMQEPRIEITYELPRMDLNYEVGQAVRENGQYNETSISAIEYDLQAYKTIITAVSR